MDGAQDSRRAGGRAQVAWGRAYLPDHAVPHAAHPLAMLAVGHQVQVIGELDHLGQLLEDVDAEALTAKLGVGGRVTTAATKRPAGVRASGSSQPGGWTPTPIPKHKTHTTPAIARRHAAHTGPPRGSRGPEGVVAVPAAGHSAGHAAACARVGALHDDKGPLFQRGHRQVPAVHHGLQGGTVARPHRVLHVEDTMVPAPHLQRVTGLSPGPSAPLSPRYSWGRWARPARTKNPPTTSKVTWGRTKQGLGREHLENRRVGARGWARGGLPAACPASGPCTFPSSLHTAADSRHLPKAQT